MLISLSSTILVWRQMSKKWRFTAARMFFIVFLIELIYIEVVTEKGVKFVWRQLLWIFVMASITLIFHFLNIRDALKKYLFIHVYWFHLFNICVLYTMLQSLWWVYNWWFDLFILFAYLEICSSRCSFSFCVGFIYFIFYFLACHILKILIISSSVND